MCVLRDLFERKMVFELCPAASEGSRAVVVGRVGRGVFVFVFDKIEVPPHDEVGGGWYSFFKGLKLDSPSRRAAGIQIKIEGSEAVRAILGSEKQGQGVAIKTFGEGDTNISVKGIDVGRNNNRNPSSGFGEATIPDSKVRE
jgi:hypothetical protein